ncbi:DUF5906 domain-containing protein [Brumimicrobium mesophilum]|uniref:DUF5906 domain-containing protein n=1 Tax=Brumimicrobium mesophilum TaxID=392717 RepID=UPI000D14298A|nr:DUF5906 domain-containing protein [Brumimicrobium mesophilum]
MKGLSLKEAKKDFPVIGKFIQEVFGENEMQVYDWLSQVKFDPGPVDSRKKRVLIVAGSPASGKSTFLEIVKTLFSFDGVEISKYELEREYNSHWIAKSMVCIDEFYFDKIKHQEIIKAMANSVFSRVKKKGSIDTAIRPKLNFLLVSNDLEGAKKLVVNNRKSFIIQTTGNDITPSPKEFLADKNKELSLMAEDELIKLTDYLYTNFKK